MTQICALCVRLGPVSAHLSFGANMRGSIDLILVGWEDSQGLGRTSEHALLGIPIPMCLIDHTSVRMQDINDQDMVR